MVRELLVCVAAIAALGSGGCITPLAQQPLAPGLAAVAAESPSDRPADRSRQVRRTAAAKPPPTRPAAVPNSSAAAWQMPWQILPLGSAPEQAGETIIFSYVPQTGFIRGTSTAVAGVGHPLVSASGPNRTVDTCRATVWSEASKSGAKEVEAVSAGPEQRDRKGDYFAPVLMRVTYQRPSGWEVRESTLTCIVDQRGKIVDAYT